MNALLERWAREVAVRALLGIKSEDNFIAQGDDLLWLIKQLAAWPTRVDPNKTTNISLLMQSAALTLEASSHERRRTDAEEVSRPRCGCPSATVERVIRHGGTCGMGGCPYGGDF